MIAEDYADRWEPDEWDTINQNEADDYRHEHDDDLPEFGGDEEEDEDGWDGEFDDSCPTCHEPADCCACIPEDVRAMRPWMPKTEPDLGDVREALDLLREQEEAGE